MHKIVARVVLATLMLSIGAGCVSSMRKMNRLEDTLRSYETAIRWSDFEAATRFQAPGADGETTVDYERLADVKVTAYEVRESGVSEDKSEATQIVGIQYYDVNTMRQSSVIDRQTWTYDEKRKRWLLKSGLPSF